MPEYFKIGKIVAAFRLEGEMIFQHILGKRTALQGVEAVYIELGKESFLPYFVQASRIKNENEFYLKLEEIHTRESALKMLNKNVWLEEQDFKRLADASAPVALLGYHLMDERKDLGEIVEVFEQPFQILCKILVEGKEVLIPLHENTLKKIDHKKREVWVTLPHDLLDIYLR